MENTKIDITSTVIEKSIDLAKSFLDKLIMPAVEETGLLIKDKVTLWKFNNQVKMLNKALAICEKNNISPKTISLKLLCPLLEYSGLEEDEILMDKWAILLSNLVDSEQNIQNHVFPYILSQLSSNEFMSLETSYIRKIERIERLTQEQLHYKETIPQLNKEIELKLEAVDKEIQELKNNGVDEKSIEIWSLQYDRKKIENEYSDIETKLYMFRYHMQLLEKINDEELKEFELSNVIRLGLVKEVKDFYANPQTLEIPNDRDDRRSHINVDFDIDVVSDTNYNLTELGELFINTCREKQKSNEY